MLNNIKHNVKIKRFIMELKFSYSMINISKGCDFILRDGKRLSHLSFAYYANTLERKTRLELATTSLEDWNSTIELLPLNLGQPTTTIVEISIETGH